VGGAALVLAASQAAAWEAVSWPGTICEPIDLIAVDHQQHTSDGTLRTAFHSETWAQCPVHTPAGLGSQEFVQWTARTVTAQSDPCLHRVLGQHGEVLSSTIARPVDFVDSAGLIPNGFAARFEWQPANSELYGVAETTSTVRCQLDDPGIGGISNVIGPGDGDMQRRRWPGTMCRPRLTRTLVDMEYLTATRNVLYNSGGALANMSETEPMHAICPVPLPTSREQGIRVHFEATFLHEGLHACTVTFIWLSDHGLYQTNWVRPDAPGRVISVDAEAPGVLGARLGVSAYCELPPAGPLGPDNITSYVTQTTW
jgi:hypothetical protein